MTFKESPFTLIAVSIIIALKACIQPADVTATGNGESNEVGTSAIDEGENPSVGENLKTTFVLKMADEAGIEINKLLYGYNTANLFFHLSDEEQGRTMISELHPNILRFPGGTSANFYHFNGPGYGLKLSDAETVAGYNAYKNTKSSAQKEKDEVQKAGLSENHAQDMVELCRASGASLLLVTNHFTGNDEENLAMIKFFKDSGVPIVGIELGNEYYLKTYSDKFPNVQTYIDAVKPLALKLKKECPEIPLAVVAAPNDEMKSMNSKRAIETAAWNNTLAKEDFYEGYVVHNYAKSKHCDQMSLLPQIADCYIKYNKELVNSTLPAGIEAYDNIFTPRKMWLTEWNVKEVFKGLGNTMLQAQYMAEHLMMLTDQDKIHMATYHNLLASGDGFNIITKSGKSSFSKSAAYYTAELLNPLFNGTVRHLALNTLIKGNNRFLSTKAFQGSSDRFLVIINQSPVQEIISLETEGNMPSEAAMTGFSADSPLSDSEQMKHYDGPIISMESITVPAYSVSLIRLPQL